MDQSFGNILVAIILAVIFFVIFGFIVKICWNFTISRIFNTQEINLAQALVLLILINILFSGARSCAALTKC